MGDWTQHTYEWQAIDETTTLGFQGIDTPNSHEQVGGWIETISGLVPVNVGVPAYGPLLDDVKVVEKNTKPDARNDSASTNEDTTKTVNVLANDLDPDPGENLKIRSASLSSGRGKVSVVNNQVKYDPRGEYDYLAVGQSATASVTYTIEDLHKSTDSATLTIAIGGINDAPTLDNTGSMRLNSISEDPSSNPGTRVTDIIASAGGDRIKDVDSGAVEGVVVYAVDNTHGTWQFSTNSGSTWSNFGSPTTSRARLLAATSSTRIRFVPTLNYNGTVSPGIRFRAWDQTSGTNGGTADVTAYGGTRSYSTAT
jgi:hypothetical protein